MLKQLRRLAAGWQCMGWGPGAGVLQYPTKTCGLEENPSQLTSPLPASSPWPPSALPMLQGTVFDYFVDEQNVCMAHWSQRVPKFTYSPGGWGSLPYSGSAVCRPAW